MSARNKLVVLAAGFAVLTAQAFGAAAANRTHHHRHHRHQQLAYRPHHHSIRHASDNTWRKTQTAQGWTNSCFSLSYLPDMWACSEN